MKQKKFKHKKQRDLMREFANTYYILQYALVHLLFFGPVIEPIKIAPKILTAFHWDEIGRALWNFRNVFVAGFAFQSAIIFLITLIPYTIALIWAAKYLIVFLFVVYQLFGFCVAKLAAWRHERRISLNNVVVVKIGAPGAGKSSSGLYEAVVMARKMWLDLRWKYFCYSKKVVQWRKESNTEKLREWNEIEFAYKYFTTPQVHKVTINGKEVDKVFMPVPCLLSNIPVMVDGKMTSFVGKEHIEQKVRAPFGSVWFLDEIGAMLSVDTAQDRLNKKDKGSNSDAIAVSDTFRLIRHFFNGRCVCTEQDSKNIYIDVRRVVSKNEYMLSQKWVLKPYLFLAIFLPLRALCVQAQDKAKPLVRPLMFLEKLCKYIGFRKYRYLTENNTERAGGMQSGKRTFYLPSMLNFYYDERTFRNFYKCKDDACKPVIHKKLVLDYEAPFDTMFVRKRWTEDAA